MWTWSRQQCWADILSAGGASPFFSVYLCVMFEPNGCCIGLDDLRKSTFKGKIFTAFYMTNSISERIGHESKSSKETLESMFLAAVQRQYDISIPIFLLVHPNCSSCSLAILALCHSLWVHHCDLFSVNTALRKHSWVQHLCGQHTPETPVQTDVQVHACLSLRLWEDDEHHMSKYELLSPCVCALL